MKYPRYLHKPTRIKGELWKDGYLHFYNTINSRNRLYHATVPQEFVLNSTDWVRIQN